MLGTGIGDGIGSVEKENAAAGRVPVALSDIGVGVAGVSEPHAASVAATNTVVQSRRRCISPPFAVSRPSAGKHAAVQFIVETRLHSTPVTRK